MSELQRRPETSPGELLIYFDTSRPLPARTLAQVLQALSVDFRRLSPKDDLVLVEAGLGSAWVKVAAALTILGATAQGVDATWDLADKISKAVEAGATSIDPGARSAEAILKAASMYSAGLYLEYTSPNGEHLKLRKEPQEAREAYERRWRARPEAVPRSGQSLSELDHHRSERMDAAIAKLVASRNQAADATAAAHLDAALAATIGFFVEEMEPYARTQSVENVAQRLESSGLYDAARLVREAGASGQGSSAQREPPLTR